MSDHADLTRALAGLDIEFPEAPEIESSRLGSPQPSRSTPMVRWAVAIGFTVFTLMVSVAPVREALADWLGIGVIEIVPIAEIPAGLEAEIGYLGDPIAVEDAGSWPALLGRPGAAYAMTDPPSVTLVWAPGRGLPEVGTSGVGVLLTRFAGTYDAPLIQKGIGPGTVVMDVSIGGLPGYWITGAEHTIAYLDAQGRPQFDSLRLAGNTLLWEVDGVAYRLESSLSREQALRVAGSLPG